MRTSPEINTRHQANAGSSENSEQHTHKTLHLGVRFTNYRKAK